MIATTTEIKKETLKTVTIESVKIPADIVWRSAIFTAKAHSHFAINNVCLDPCEGGGANLVATNGHVLMVYHIKGDWILDKQYILDIKEDTFKKCKGKKAEYLTVHDKRLTVFASDDSEVYIQPLPKGETYNVDGRFPDYRQIIPVSGTAETVSQYALGIVLHQLVKAFPKNAFKFEFSTDMVDSDKKPCKIYPLKDESNYFDVDQCILVGMPVDPDKF